MGLSTSSFLFLFLPAVFIVFQLLPSRWKKIFLFIASLVFYAWSGIEYLPVLLSSILINHGIGLELEKQSKSRSGRTLLIIGICLNLSGLFVYKYLDFFMENLSALLHFRHKALNIPVPPGLSFFTFQAISYIVEIYKGRPALRNLLDTGLYMAFFPRVLSGPIITYKNGFQIPELRIRNAEQIKAGLERVVTGLIKKVVLADNLGLLCSPIFEGKNHEAGSVLLYWLAAAACSLQIYYDFSGYSDMAIGAGQMFGFTLPENFNYPYTAHSFTDFWRRWHISLSSWFRDYVYFPLGGSRVSIPRHLLNLAVVWILTGLWHGAVWNFVLWGLGWFILLVLEKYVIRPERLKKRGLRILYRVVVMSCTALLWTVFMLPSPVAIRKIFSILLGTGKLPLANRYFLFELRDNWFFLLTAIVFASPFVNRLRNNPRVWIRIIYWVLLCLGLLLSISYIMLNAYNPFMYIQF